MMSGEQNSVISERRACNGKIKEKYQCQAKFNENNKSKCSNKPIIYSDI